MARCDAHLKKYFLHVPHEYLWHEHEHLPSGSLNSPWSSWRHFLAGGGAVRTARPIASVPAA